MAVVLVTINCVLLSRPGELRTQGDRIRMYGGPRVIR